jgi:uncharacterized membrane protein YdjX (TVP38/TMEM64 family)
MLTLAHRADGTLLVRTQTVNEPEINQRASKAEPAKASPLRRFLPILLLACAMAVFFGLGAHRHVQFETLVKHHAALVDWVAAHPVLSILAYIGGYAACVAVSVPGGVYLTIFGGFLFGTVKGTLFAAIGATIGATAVFLAAKTALGDSLRKRAGPTVRRMEDGFRSNAFGYLLALRLIPLFPFWLVNLVPAFLGVRLGTYLAATAIGILPATLVFASIGNGIAAVLAEGGMPDREFVHKPEIFLPLLGLAALALLPGLYKRLRDRRQKRNA